MDRVNKFLRALDRKARLEMAVVIGKIIRNDFSGLDVKKLKGRDQLYRVRIGSLRIIYYYRESSTMILSIERRSEKTYR